MVIIASILATEAILLSEEAQDSQNQTKQGPKMAQNTLRRNQGSKSRFVMDVTTCFLKKDVSGPPAQNLEGPCKFCEQRTSPDRKDLQLPMKSEGCVFPGHVQVSLSFKDAGLGHLSAGLRAASWLRTQRALIPSMLLLALKPLL